MERLHVGAAVSQLQGRRERFLAVAMTVLYLGTGLSYSLLALYLVRYLHVGAVSYGVGMSVAALLGFVSGPVMGDLTDRINGYLLYAVLMWTMCVATAAVIFAGAWLALALLSVLTICGRGSAAVIGALIGREVPPDRRIRYRAVVKSLSNSAMVVGLGLGAVVLANGTKWAFQVGFAAESLTFLVAGWLVLLAARPGTAESGLGRQAADDVEPGLGKSRRGVLRDGKFMLLTALNGVFALSESMLTVALPLWVSTRLHAPLWLVSVAMVVYTVGIVLLQIPASRHVSGLPASARAGRRGGLLFAVAAVMFPVAAVVPGVVAEIGVVVVLALAVVGGEVLYSAGSWGLVYGLAPERSLGRYQGVFNTGFDVSMMVGPALFAWLVSEESMLGWIVLSVVFAAGAALLVSVTERENAPTAAVGGT